MKKILLTIFYQFDPWHSSIGGIQTVVQNFVKFSPAEFVIRLVGVDATADGAIGQWQQRELAGRPVEFFPLFRLREDDRRRLIPTSLRYALGLWGKDFASDFMHFHRLEPSLFTMRWQGHKMLFVHNDIHQQMRSSETKGILWRRFPWLYFWFERQLMPQFHRILSCNSESTALYQQQYPQFADRISLVRNCFDGEIFYPHSKEVREEQRRQQAIEMGLAEDTRFLLFAGRLHPQKDPLLLLEAVSLIVDRQKKDPSAAPVHLLIAGEGELAAAMHERVAQLGISEQVTFAGALSHQQTATLHRLASAFVLTSAYEGLPLVVLESLACGTPVVTTQAGETPRLLKADCGIVCSTRSPKTIASALQTILQSPEKFPAAACVQAASPYSAKTVVKDIYDTMLRTYERPEQPDSQQSNVRLRPEF